MNINYKLFGFIPVVFVMNSCIFHRNIVESIDRTKVELRDVSTNKHRTILRDTTRAQTECSGYTYIGDTVYVRSTTYNKEILKERGTHVYVNYDSICARQCRDSLQRIR